MDQFASDIVLTEGIEEKQEIDENNLNNPLTGKECNHYIYLTIISNIVTQYKDHNYTTSLMSLTLHFLTRQKIHRKSRLGGKTNSGPYF